VDPTGELKEETLREFSMLVQDLLGIIQEEAGKLYRLANRRRTPKERAGLDSEALSA
jgi:hypothetical protein